MQDQGNAPAVDFWDRVRRDIIGGSAVLEGPFGRRRLTYADHTASGRAVGVIEDYMREVLAAYGNTHTEDDATGTITSSRLRGAEAAIKRLVNAGPEHKIISVGAGTTAAVHQLQQILGIYVPPAGKDLFAGLLKAHLPAPQHEGLVEQLRRARPVVFVGPYEHHSNEVSWRECFAEVVEIELDARGMLDLEDLRRRLAGNDFKGRRKIGAFSAASNVSGVKTPVREVARILHEHDALAFFDFAAIAPYDPIDMRPDGTSSLDAIYFSPHKFLGGPGSCGILIFHQRIYRADLPPTIGAGGTVDFVNFDGQAYSSDIEVREKPGTPGILQTLRASLAMELKEKLGQSRISAREKMLVHRAYERLAGNPAVELMGDVGPDDRLPIFSFNIRVGASWLHPRFVTRLLNDLFGIQSRAGCSCAAPYGHRVLHIDGQKSADLRKSIMCGNIGLKPGWARVNFHFLHTDAEVDFICRAILFVAEHGRDFLPLYAFDIHTGTWEHKDFTSAPLRFGIEEALAPHGGPTAEDGDLEPLFAQYMAEAERLAAALKVRWSGAEMKSTEKDLIPFVYY
jgi:selenocysteine lyase/cysteine desulfurase